MGGCALSPLEGRGLAEALPLRSSDETLSESNATAVS